MRVSKAGYLAVLALICSCRGAGDVPGDTDGVGPGTRTASSAAAAPNAPDAPAAIGPADSHGTEPATPMLVWTESGIQAVDLTRDGALLAEWRGEAEHVELSPDGSMFAARTSDRIHLVRISDGARASYALRPAGDDEPIVQWTANAAYWTDADGVRIVDRASFGELTVKMADGYVTASKDGRTFVVSRQSDGRDPGVVEVWRLGETKPRSHVVSAYVEQVTVDDDGSRVAWAESSDEYDAKAFLHTLDVGSGVHARFSAQGHCAIGVEQIVGFEDGALTTDAECSPGCPSLPSQAQFIAYDFATGRKLREWSGELIPPAQPLPSSM